MRFKKFLPLTLCVLLAVSLLAGCSRPGEITQSPSDGTMPPIEETQTALEPIQQLTCVHAETIPNIIPAGDGCVLLCWTDDQATTTYLNLVDTAKDTVKGAIQLEGWWDLRNASFSDGCYVLCDMNNNKFRFLNQNLEEVGSFAPENTDGVFSHDRSSFFFLKDQQLYRTDIRSGETAIVKLPYDLHFLSIFGMHPTQDQIGLSFFISPYGTKCGTAIYDFNSGELLMMQEDNFQVDFRRDSVCFLSYGEQDMTYSYIYGSNQAGFRLAPSSLFKNDQNVSPIYGSDYLMGVGGDSNLYRLGDEIAVCSLAGQGISGSFFSTCFLPEEESLFGGVFQDGVCQFYVVRPSRLSFSTVAQAETVTSPMAVSPELGNAYWGFLSGTDLPTDMNEVQILANGLEQKYGVHIRLSGKYAESCEYEIITTEEMNYPDRPQRIARFLNSLDQCLALYPEGFFRQFTNSQGDGGIYFMPAGEIVDDANLVGVCYERFGWNYIAVEVDADGLAELLCHEIWHATENKILGTVYGAFTDNGWDMMNPPGFQYYRDNHLTDPNQNKWTLLGEPSDGVYFIDGYSRVNEFEDRARIMEYVMAQENFEEAMMASPALMQKLQCMCNAIRECFDTTGWGNVRWERLLNQ